MFTVRCPFAPYRYKLKYSKNRAPKNGPQTQTWGRCSVASHHSGTPQQSLIVLEHYVPFSNLPGVRGATSQSTEAAVPLLFLGWRCSHVMPKGNSPDLLIRFEGLVPYSKPNGSATVTVLAISSGLGAEQTGNKEMAISHLASYLFGRDSGNKAVRRASAFVSYSVSTVSQGRTATTTCMHPTLHHRAD